MSLTLLRPRVHSESAPAIVEPARFDEPEPFRPSLVDQAHDAGYSLGRAGDEPDDAPADYHRDSDAVQSFYNGLRAGRRARGVDEARELGLALGESGSCLSEPPPGLDPAGRAAYREGYAEGLGRHDAMEAQAAEHDAWVDAAYAALPARDLDTWSRLGEYPGSEVYPYPSFLN